MFISSSLFIDSGTEAQVREFIWVQMVKVATLMEPRFQASVWAEV